MNNIIPIQITLQAANAADARQLVQDLAGTMNGIQPEQIPSKTVAAAYPVAIAPQPEQYAQPVYQPPVQQPAYQPPVQNYGVVPVQQPIQQPMQQPQGVPTATQTYDMQQLAVAATALIDGGKHVEVTQLLQQQFGVQALTALPKERYGEFATALRAMGARI